MDRRTFLGALASGGAVALAGCTGRRETLHSVSATPEIPGGGFYHEPLSLEGEGRQLNLQYDVTADDPFDVLLFGGQADPTEFAVYRQAVGGPGGTSGSGDGRQGSEANSGEKGVDPPGRCQFGNRSGADHDHDAGRHADCPHASDWHSVVGAGGRAEVNRPLSPGTHHFVVDNTTLGDATPDGPLRPTVDLAVRDFELFPG